MNQTENFPNSPKSTQIFINDQPIPWQEVLGYMQIFGKLQPFLRELLSQYVLVEEINKRDDLPIESSDLMQAIMDFRLSQKLTESDKFEEWLKSQNLDNRSFQNRVGFGLKIEKLKEKVAEPNLQSYFEKNQQSFAEVQLYCVITDQKELLEKIKEIISEKNITIKEISQECANSEQNIRFFKQKVQQRSLSESLRDQLASASVGDLIGPVEADNTWGLFRVEEIIPAQLDKKLKKQIEEQLFGQWLVEKLKASNIALEL